MLELGCGCGLVGLCYAACGADVLLTDLPEPLVLPSMHTPLGTLHATHVPNPCDPAMRAPDFRSSLASPGSWERVPSHAQEIVRENIARNADTIAAAGGSAHACELVWGVTHAAELGPEWAAPDVVVAADVVYRRELFQPLLHALAELCMLLLFIPAL